MGNYQRLLNPSFEVELKNLPQHSSLLEQMRSSNPAFVELLDETKGMLQDRVIGPEAVVERMVASFFMGYADGVGSTKPDEEVNIKQRR